MPPLWDPVLDGPNDSPLEIKVAIEEASEKPFAACDVQSNLVAQAKFTHDVARVKHLIWHGGPSRKWSVDGSLRLFSIQTMVCQLQLQGLAPLVHYLCSWKQLCIGCC